MRGNHFFEIVGTDGGGRQNLKMRLIFSENLECGIDLFQKTWNGNLVILDQHLSKKDEMDFTYSKHWTKKPIHFETNKL